MIYKTWFGKHIDLSKIVSISDVYKEMLIQKNSKFGSRKTSMRKFYKLKPGVILKNLARHGEDGILNDHIYALRAYRRLHAVIMTRKTGIKLEPHYKQLFSLEFGVEFDHDECEEITDVIDLNIKKAQWEMCINDEPATKHYNDIDWPLLN